MELCSENGLILIGCATVKDLAEPALSCLIYQLHE